MPRLISVDPAAAQELTVAVGDVLSFAASGGHLLIGSSVEFLGAFVTAVVATDGRVLQPAGAPHSVLVRVTGPGHSTVRLFPFGGPGQVGVDVVLTTGP